MNMFMFACPAAVAVAFIAVLMNLWSSDLIFADRDQQPF
jgi:nitrogen fixation-related uncharacterized protein